MTPYTVVVTCHHTNHDKYEPATDAVLLQYEANNIKEVFTLISNGFRNDHVINVTITDTTPINWE